MATNYAAFSVTGASSGAHPSVQAGAANNGVDATAGEVVSCLLETPDPVSTVTFAVYDAADESSPVASKGADALVFVASGTASVSPDPTVAGALTMPATASGQSWIVRATVVAGGTTYVYERIVCLRTPKKGRRKPVPAETTQYSQRGWADEWDDTVDDVEGGGAALPAYLDTTDSPAGLWTLNGVLTDSSGHGLNLVTDDASAAMFTDVVPGMQGWGCNGSRYLKRSTTDAGLSSTGALTIECVVAPNTRASGTRPFVAFVDGGGANCLYEFGVTTSGLLYYQSQHGASVTETKVSTKAIAPVTGALLTMTRNAAGTSVSFYVNGKLLDTITGCTQPTAGTGTQLFRIGNNNSVYLSDGSVCSVRVTMAEKNAAAVLAAYNASLGQAWGQRA